MKKYLIAPLLASLTLTAADARGLNGFYVGAGAGMNITRTNSTLSGTTLGDHIDAGNGFFTAPTTNTAISNIDTYETDSGNIDLIAGYGRILQNCFYIGGELQLDANISNSQDVSKSNEYMVTIKQNGANFAILLRGGIVMTTKSMLYAAFGVRTFKTDYNVPSASTTAGFYSIPYNTSYRAYRFCAELGAEGLFGNTDSFGWRANYAYSNPGTKTGGAFPYNHTFNSGLTSVAGSYSRFKTTCHIVRFTVMYRF